MPPNTLDKIASQLVNSTDDLLFGLGTSQIASLGRRLKYKNALQLFESAFENGIQIIDTADAYGSGDAEYLVGQILDSLGINPFIITKAGLPYSAVPHMLSPVNQIMKKIKEGIRFKKNFKTEYIIKSLNKSLKRLRKKRLGAFLLHDVRDEDIRSTNCWEALFAVKKSGLVLFTGISSNDFSVIKEGIESGQVSLVQTQVQVGNVNSREIVNLCKTHRIPILANEVLKPLHLCSYNFEQIMSEVKLFHGLEQINAAQLLIGGAYAEMKFNCMLFGTRRPEHLIQNIHTSRFLGYIKKHFNVIEKIISDNKIN